MVYLKDGKIYRNCDTCGRPTQFLTLQELLKKTGMEYEPLAELCNNCASQVRRYMPEPAPLLIEFKPKENRDEVGG